MNTYYITNKDELSHHGVIGMKWGVRRYQNYDGTLTPAGRAKLHALNGGKVRPYERHLDPNSSSDDIVIKKGQSANRVIKWSPDNEGARNGFTTEESTDQYDSQHKHDPNFYSVDGLLNRGAEGKDFYAIWFGDSGWDADKIRIDDYEFKRDTRVANGKKVVETYLESHGDEPISSVDIYGGKRYLGDYADYRNMSVKDIVNNISPDYVGNHKSSSAARFFDERSRIGQTAVDAMTNRIMNDRTIRSEIIAKLSKQGYHAMEDVHDRISDFPVMLFDPGKTLKKTGSEYGMAYYTRRHGTKFT